MVDFRKDYDGRFPEPPYQTALDYDSLVAHNAALEQRLKELEAERNQLKSDMEVLAIDNLRLDTQVKDICSNEINERFYELYNEIDTLRAENGRLREALVKISEWGCNGQCVTSLSGQRRKRQVK